MYFIVAGVYGMLLAVLIFSSLVTPVIVDLFVASPYTLGTHGADWEYWQGTSCAFVGLVGFFGRGLDPRAQRMSAFALAFVFGVWGIQNLRLVLMTDRYDALMWLHVSLCLIVGAWGVVTALRTKAKT